MDTPLAPRDSSLRNIIDKLAEFVARNGPEFELITKQKQQGNPKFEFLYGGEHCNYYQYRVAAEQAFLKQQGSLSQASSHASHPQQQQQQHYHHQGPSQQHQQHENPNSAGIMYQNQSMNSQPAAHLWGVNPVNPAAPSASNGNAAAAMNLTAQIETINMQQNALRDQIQQSELNLSAQHSALMSQQKKQIDEAIAKAQNHTLDQQAQENNISLMEFDDVLQPIIEACTKDSISAGKNWILQHSTDTAKNNVVLQYLLKKALVNGSTFTQKLHLIYLVNDILHHCVRKNANELKNSLENVVIPMFCSAELIASDEQRSKLIKLLSLWESKAKFFDACVISKLQSPDSSMQEYKTNLMNVHHEVTSSFTHATKATLESYQKQHQIFIQHATQQIQVLEQQKQNMEQQILAAVLPNAAILPSLIDVQQLVASSHTMATNINKQQIINSNKNKLPTPQPLMAQKISMPSDDDDSNVEGLGNSCGGGSVGGNDSVDLHMSFSHLKIPPDENNQPLYGSLYNNHQLSGNLSDGGGDDGISMQQQFSSNPSNDYYQLTSTQSMFPSSGHCSDSNEYPPAPLPSFLIPDLSKPPPGFLNSGNGTAQQLAAGTHAALEASVAAASGAGTSATASLGNSAYVHPAGIVAQVEGVTEGILDAVPVPIEEEPKPSAPYYDLPAGLMVSLIRLEDYNYRPLNPDEIRLPPPTPQSERLTLALAAFYAPPSHNRPRDNEGWEKLGLYEYYKVKNAARKQKEDELKEGTREKTRSPSPIVIDTPKPKKINKRCYRSKSRSRSPRAKSRSPYRLRSESPPPAPPPPPTRPQSERSRSSRYSNSQRNRSPPSRRSPNRDRPERGERGAGVGGGGSGGVVSSNERNDRDRERDRERDSSRDSNSSRQERNSTRRERERSVTPPSFFGGNYGKSTEFIEETNKGHQMLMKMGWAGSGTGLGTKNQGIDQPISGGEVRDRKDMYKGVGININDPFENFRKNKGAAFVHRMRSRADEKS